MRRALVRLAGLIDSTGSAQRPPESGEAAPGRGGRMSRQRKTAAVLRLLRGEDLETARSRYARLLHSAGVLDRGMAGRACRTPHVRGAVDDGYPELLAAFLRNRKAYIGGLVA